MATDLTKPRRMTRNQRAAQRLLDYCADNGAWSIRPSKHVVEALRILTGKPDATGSPDHERRGASDVG